MGQYYIIVNLTKGEYIDPGKIRDCGLKLTEMRSAGHMLLGLLTPDNGRGGGDFAEHNVWGRWAGDRIVVAGDYGDAGEWIPGDVGVKKEPSGEMNLYEYMLEYGTDITDMLPKSMDGDSEDEEEDEDEDEEEDEEDE